MSDSNTTPPCSPPCGAIEVEVEEGELLEDPQDLPDMSDIRYKVEVMSWNNLMCAAMRRAVCTSTTPTGTTGGAGREPQT